MKVQGVIRRFDDLGRFVIPKEIRKSLNWKEGTAIDITVKDGKVILEECKLFECEVCGQPVNEEDNFCKNCGKELKNNG